MQMYYKTTVPKDHIYKNVCELVMEHYTHLSFVCHLMMRHEEIATNTIR